MYVLMVVPSDFPNGDAGAVRDLAFAKIYQNLGYEVVLIGNGKNFHTGLYNGVEYYSFYEKRKTKIDHFRYYFGHKNKLINCLNNIELEKGIPDVIHINHISEGSIKYLTNLSQKKNIPIIHDSTEWYSPCEFRKGRFDKSYILKDRLNRKLIKSPMKVIAISKYLENYFKNKGLDTVRIPVIMDSEKIQKTINDSISSKIQFIYAGSPGKKDNLKEVMHGFMMLSNKEKDRIEFHVLGITKEELKSICNIKEIESFVNVYGRVPRDEVLKIMKEMDFSVLLRPEKERYTKAGFPTKSVESMMNGVAMMCNLTSDLEDYLVNKENAIIVKDCSRDSFVEALRVILNLKREKINNIKKEAYKLAENEFDYRKYINTVKKLLPLNKEQLYG